MDTCGGDTTSPPVLLTNLGAIVTGDPHDPVARGDTILVEDGVITGIGERGDVPGPADAIVVDADGQEAIPGLIDSHIHPSVGDYTPRTKTHDWLEAYSQAGVTTAVSQGSWHTGAYPDDRWGMLALATWLTRSFAGYRPGGMKVHGGTVSLVEGLVEEDFALLKGEGTWLIAEVGSRSIVDPETVRGMLEVAHGLGFVSRVHFGPEAVPGTYTVSAAMAAVMGAHIASHVNGGPSTPPEADLDFMVEEQDCFLELSYPGNHRALLRVAERARDLGMLHRLTAGSDTPTGSGIQPRAIMQTVGLLAAFLDIPAAQAVAVGTGNTAASYRLNTGRLEVGREADVLLIDSPRGSSGTGGLHALELGDSPSVSLLMIDGRIVSVGTRNTLPPKRRPVVTVPS
ncbi:MAG: amidohydrolase family protein [Acidimicrobiales bacterium]